MKTIAENVRDIDRQTEESRALFAKRFEESNDRLFQITPEECRTLGLQYDPNVAAKQALTNLDMLAEYDRQTNHPGIAFSFKSFDAFEIFRSRLLETMYTKYRLAVDKNIN